MSVKSKGYNKALWVAYLTYENIPIPRSVIKIVPTNDLYQPQVDEVAGLVDKINKMLEEQ